MSDNLYKIRLGDGGRYSLTLNGSRNFRFLPTEDFALATDETNGKCVLLHFFCEKDAQKQKNTLMLEADTASALEDLTEDCAAPLLLEDSFVLHCEDEENVACLVYSAPADCCPFEIYLSENAPRPSELLELVKSVANTVAFAAHRGIKHGNLDPWHVLIDENGKARIFGYGMIESATVSDDEEAIAELARRALRSLPRVHRSGEEKEAVKQLSKIADGDIYCEGKNGSHTPVAALRICFLLLFTMLIGSAYVIADHTIRGKHPAQSENMPRLVGLVYSGYDETEKKYVFTDGQSGERVTLDGNIYTLTADTTEDYYIYHDGVTDFGYGGIIYSDAVANLGDISDGTVVSQTPAPNKSIRIQPGYRLTEIKITLQRGDAKLAIKSDTIVGLDLEAAKERLDKLNVKYTVSVRYNRKLPRGTVYSVFDGSDTEKTSICYGDSVVLLVSGGEKN